MSKIYFKLDENNIIRDAIEYSYEGYTEVDLPDTQLPAGINGGWYRWTGTAYEEVPELKPVSEADKIKSLEERILLMQQALDDIILNGYAL